MNQAIKSAFAPENLAFIIGGNAQQKQQGVTQDASGLVDKAVDDDVIAITMNTAQSGPEGALVSADPNDPRPQNLFTSVSVPLASRVSSKIKAKIWANEFISFGTLLSDSPQEVGKYSLSMAPSVGASTQPQLTLEPCHTSKRITNISQWVSAFTIFVSVYSEKVVNQAAQLMKYCEVVRDLALKGGDWHWYDEQFRYGFRVNFVGERASSESPNLKSALERPDITRAKLHQECDAGRIVGPFSTPPFLNFRCSPLGLVPKKDPSEFRMIHHLSYSKGSSVNDFIPDYYSTVKYASVGDAIKLLKRLGPGCFMAKTDVKSGF